MSQPLIMPFADVRAYAERAGLSSRTVFEAERVSTPPPAVTPREDARFFAVGPNGYDFHAVTVTPMRDIVVRSMSNLLTAPDAILRHDLINITTEGTPEQALGKLGLSQDRTKAAWAAYDPFKAHHVPEAAVFTDGTSFNYAHWLTEILPRIAAFVDERGAAPVPLMVDSDLHPNVRRSLDLIAPKAKFYRIAPDNVVRVSDLHYVAATGYVPFRLRRQPLEDVCHGVFGASALRHAVARLRKAAAFTRAPARPRLYVRRTTQVRRLLNEAEVEQALVARGFQTITPETLSLDEQISLFSQAEMVVGSTGAGMANLAFCAPDCPVVVLMPRFLETAYWYWRRISAAAGAGPVIHVSGPQAQALDDAFDPRAIAQDYRVEMKDVISAVDEALALKA
jgi:capsular polysaccharide biosynthesis protein